MISLRQGQKLQVILAGAVNTTEPPVAVAYHEGDDLERAVNKTTGATTNGGTAVDLVTGVAEGRTVDTFSLFNSDLASIVVTVRLYDVGGTTRILRQCTLLTLEGLHWNKETGWYAVDANGNRKSNSSSGDSTNISTALSTAVRASSTASTLTAANPASVSSQASSIAAVNPHTVSSIQSVVSTASFTNTTWSTVSSAASRVKSSFTW